MTSSARRPPDCADPYLRLGGVLPKVGRGVLDLFADRRVVYSFNTRVAIRTAVDLLGLKPGDEVLAPAYNCGSELDPLRAAGLDIRLYPVDTDTVVDPDRIAPLIGARTRAIYLTHYFGVLQPHRAGIRALADARGMRVIEDCALSLLSGAHPVEGRTGDVAVFCFYKFFPVLAGGALVVNATDLAVPAFARPAPAKTVVRSVLRMGLRRTLGPRMLDRLRGRRPAGQGDDDPADGLPDMPAGYYFDPDLVGRGLSGFTARALTALDPVEATQVRRVNYRRLLGHLADVGGMAPLFAALPGDAVPLSLPLQVQDPGPGAAWRRRNALVRALQAEGIAATPWWAGYNRYLDFADHPGADLSTARLLKDTVISLPIHQYFGSAEIDHVADRVRGVWQGQG
jgi:perosamine synthetase